MKSQYQKIVEGILNEREQIEEGWGQNLATGVLSTSLLFNPLTMGNVEASKTHGLSHRNYSEQEIINAIVGEASNQGYEGMLAIANAIRNRAKVPYYKNNILHGVYGKDNPVIKKSSPQVFITARKAWEDSKTKDIVKGAYLWGNDKDIEIFKKQSWFRNVTPTVKIGAHTFFK